MIKRINRRKRFLKATIERYEFKRRCDGLDDAFNLDVEVRNLRERKNDIMADIVYAYIINGRVKIERYNKKVWMKEELGVK